MRIAVTGASGFIGMELLNCLRKKDDTEIIALTRGSSEHSAPSNCMWVTSDYSSDSLANAFRNVDVVVHLAAVRGTSSNSDDYAVNEEITDNVIDAMIKNSVKRIVFASTISVYDDVATIPWKEESSLRGRTAYGDSKIVCENMIRESSDLHGFTYAIARIAQVIGEGEKRRGMMNVFIDTARHHGTLKVIGKSVAKRQYVHVDDLVEILGMVAVGANGFSVTDSIILNVGMERAYSNLEIAAIVNKVFSNPSPIEYDDSTTETIKSAYMDTNRLSNMFNYSAMDMDEAIGTFL